MQNPRRQALLFGPLIAFTLSAVNASDDAEPSATGQRTGNPHTSTSDVNQGRNFFRVFCARCHGLDARGAKGPDLTDGNFRHARNDEQLFRVIANGIPGTDMAGFGSDAEGGDSETVWQMVSFIRAEEKNRGLSGKSVARGNVARGRLLFEKHKCATCHWTGRSGGRRGTNLSQLAAGADYVRRSLINPSAQIDDDYQPLQIVRTDGRTVSGRRLNENTYFVLLMDEKERLITVPRDEIEELVRPKISLMPSYKDVLSPTDIEDLTAFVLSLRNKGIKK